MTRQFAVEAARDLTLVLENDEGTYTQLREACFKAITEGSGYADPQDAVSAYRSRRDEFRQPCAIYVRDEVWDMLDLSCKGHESMTLTEKLFTEVVNYDDNELWDEFADSYMPDDDDLEEWVAENK